MNVKLIPNSDRKLVGCISLDAGVYLFSTDGKIFFISGRVVRETTVELKSLLADPRRLPIYEGDKIEISF